MSLHNSRMPEYPDWAHSEREYANPTRKPETGFKPRDFLVWGSSAANTVSESFTRAIKKTIFLLKNK